MKIQKIETIRIAEHANICWVEVHTDEGVTGLGETFFGAEAVEAYIHETAAPLLIGRDPLQIEAISRALTGYLGFASTGVEMRGNSA
ncbi:MAG: Mandelate racemase, partial [Devosia sp.]|nr:Mandelate racemase [Devosia sp.]